VSDELDKMEVGVAYFDILFQHLLGMTTGYHEKLQFLG
jgi:hypothetical protein